MRVNIPIALLSLVLSLVLWLMVYGQNLPEQRKFTITHVTDTLKDAQRQHWFVTLPPSLTVNLEAPSQKLDEVAGDIKDLKAVINLDHPIEGSNQKYPFTLSSDMIARLMTDQHPSAVVTVEKITQKDHVPVLVVDIDKLADAGLRLTSQPTSRKDVVVTGPQSAMSKVWKVRAYLDLSKITATGDQVQSATLTAIDVDGAPVQNVHMSPDSVDITPIVTPVPTEKLVTVSPIFIGQPAEGFLQKGYDRLDPQEVAVTGPPNITSGMQTNVDTEPIDVSGTSAPKTFKAKLILPIGVSCAHRTVSVRFLVRPDPNYRKPAATTPSSTNPQPPFGNLGGPTTAGPTGTTTGQHQ